VSAVSTTDIAGAKPPDDRIPHPRSGRQTSRMNIENRQGLEAQVVDFVERHAGSSGRAFSTFVRAEIARVSLLAVNAHAWRIYPETERFGSVLLRSIARNPALRADAGRLRDIDPPQPPRRRSTGDPAPPAPPGDPPIRAAHLHPRPRQRQSPNPAPSTPGTRGLRFGLAPARTQNPAFLRGFGGPSRAPGAESLRRSTSWRSE
jgi:hypothetical protein